MPPLARCRESRRRSARVCESAIRREADHDRASLSRRATARRYDGASETITFNTSGDRDSFLLKNATFTGVFDINYVSGTSDTLDYYSFGPNQNQRIDYSHDTLGRRTADDALVLSRDTRTYTYDGRNNLASIAGEYWYSPGSAWHAYTISYFYDERNRLYFKSFVDEDQTCGGNPCEAHTFFFWDQFDRLIQAKHTPDISSPGTNSVFQWYWLGDKPIIYYQIDGVLTTRRWLHADEQGRPLTAWSWPTLAGTDTSQLWEVDPGLFGWDEVTVGAGTYQPLRFPGQLYDEDSEAWYDSGGTPDGRGPGICYNRFLSYDSLTGGYLQVDPLVSETWDGYGYAEQNPVMNIDPTGLSCGPECLEGGDFLAPDSFTCPIPLVGGTVNFLSSCDSHDACYLTCGASKLDCDNNFQADLASACTSRFGAANPCRYPCLLLTNKMWVGVVLGGYICWGQAQRNCVEPPPLDSGSGGSREPHPCGWYPGKYIEGLLPDMTNCPLTPNTSPSATIGDDPAVDPNPRPAPLGIAP